MSRQTWASVVAVGLTAVLPFVSTLHGYFLSDDFGLVQHFSGKPPQYFLTLFTHTWVGDLYGGATDDELRPTLALSYRLDALWGATSPTAYHVTNLALHAITALLVLATARSVAGLPLPVATFAAAVFALLPVHAETVAWISGRADSLPTALYVGSFLAFAQWRRSGSGACYAVSLGLAVLALFSKQSAITLVATLLTFDLLVARRPLRLTRELVFPHVPFVLATIGYLGLRYVLFGQAVREDEVTTETLLAFGAVQAVHLRMLVSSVSILGPRRLPLPILSAGVVGALVVAGLVLRRMSPARRGPLLFFGPVWWLICTAPLLVTYPTPRHLYLAVVGPAIALGIAFDALWTTRRRLWRAVAVVVGAGILLGNGWRLEREVGDWNSAATVSETISRDVQRQAAATPRGALLVLGVPAEGVTPGVGVTARYTMWSWALPFAVQPPFAEDDLAQRAFLVMPPEAYCCPRQQWLASVRESVRAWSAQAPPAPVIVLLWDGATGALVRSSDADDPGLRPQVQQLADADTPAEFCRRLDTLLRQQGSPLGERWQRTVDWRCTG